MKAKLIRMFFMIMTVTLIVGTLIACSNTKETTTNNNDTPTENNDDATKEDSKKGGSITIAHASEPGNLNPLIWATATDVLVTRMVFDTIVVPDEELNLEGSLAKEWDLSDDGKTYTFYLHENVKWHDGQPFTAKDVEFTFTSLAHPEYDMGANWRVNEIVGADSYRNGEADSIEGINVINDYTISFTTKEPFAPFLSSLYIGILPKHILGDVSPGDWAKHEFNRAPVGTGPFQFEKWETGQYMQFKANEEYFAGAPYLDRIITRFGDQNTMLAAFIGKEIDIAPVPITELSSVENVPHANLALANQLSVFYVGFNSRNKHFNDVKVRHAIAHAINKGAINSTILNDLGHEADSVFPSKHWSYNPNLPQYNYNPSKAEELLEEAGYKKNARGIYEKDGNELTFYLETPTGTVERERTAVLLQQDLSAVGINMEIRSLDFATLVTKLLPKTQDGRQREVTEDDYDAYILGYGVTADPDEYRTYFGSAYMPPNGYNFVGYSNPEVDKLLEDQKEEVDFDKRQQLIWKTAEILAEDLIWIPLYEQPNTFVANDKVGGFEPDFRGPTFNARKWYVKEN